MEEKPPHREKVQERDADRHRLWAVSQHCGRQEMASLDLVSMFNVDECCAGRCRWRKKSVKDYDRSEHCKSARSETPWRNRQDGGDKEQMISDNDCGKAPWSQARGWRISTAYHVPWLGWWVITFLWWHRSTAEKDWFHRWWWFTRNDKAYPKGRCSHRFEWNCLQFPLITTAYFRSFRLSVYQLFTYFRKNV